MNRKRLFITVLSFTLLLFFLAPLPFSEFGLRFAGVGSVRIFFDERIKSLWKNVEVLFELHAVGKRNRELEKELSRLRVNLMMNEGIKRENEELSKLLKIKDSYSRYAIIPARILNYSAVNPNRITVHFPPKYKRYMSGRATVVSSMGMVGLVSSFSEESAEVELITSKQFTIPAVLESREECTAVIRGNGRSLSILFLDKVCGEPSAEGKKLLSANLSQNFSLPYIPIGIIGNLEEDSGNILFLKGEAIPLFKKGRLNHLFIVVGESFQDEKLHR